MDLIWVLNSLSANSESYKSGFLRESGGALITNTISDNMNFSHMKLSYQPNNPGGIPGICMPPLRPLRMRLTRFVIILC